MTTAQISAVLPFDGKKIMLISDEDQNTPGIVEALEKKHRLDKLDYDKFSESFWAGDAKKTAENLFKYLKQNVTYKVEPALTQTVKTPGRLLHDRYGDCKHYSLFITGIVDSLHRKGYPISAKYRFVADRPDMDVHHVFSVVSGKDGEYWTDPVLNRFNERPNFYNIQDSDMAVYSLSGTERGVEVAQVGLSFKKNPFAQFAHAMDVNFKNVQHGVKVNAANIAHGMDVNKANINKGIKQVQHGLDVNFQNAKTAVLKVGIVPARKAFLSLVALNVRSLATNLAKLKGTPQWAKLMSKWKNDLGGDPKVLDQAIHNGNNRKRLGYIHGGGIGVVDLAAIAAWTALASAVLAVLKEFIHAPGNPASPQLQMAEAADATAGTAGIFANAYNAGVDLSQPEAPTLPAYNAAAAAMNNFVDPGYTTGTMSITPSVTTDGAPQVTVHDIDDPVVRSAGRPDKPDGTPNTAITDFINDIKDTIHNVWTDYKMPIIFIGTGVVVYKVATAPPRKKRR